MALAWRPIVPKFLNVIDAAQTQRNLLLMHQKLGFEMAGQLQKYPSQQPTKYRRTGTYGRNWTAPGSIKATSEGVRVVNRTGYGLYVGGPHPGHVRRRQTPVMRRKGWKSVSDVARENRKRYRLLVQGAMIHGRRR